MKSRSIILSGASGWLGREILQSTARETALGLYRIKPQRDATNPALTGDLSASACATQLIDQYRKLNIEADCFIHCAGLAHQPNETEFVKVNMWRTNDQGTASALEFCQRVGVKRFVYVSTIAGYDWSSDKAVDEGSKQALLSEYAKSKVAAEQRVLAAPLDSRVVRLATVYGTGDRANFARLANVLRKRRFPIPGDGSARKSVIPIDTAARLIAKFAMMDHLPHKTINLALPEAPQLGEICDAFSRLCGVPRAPRLPLLAMKALAKTGDFLGLIREVPFNSDVLHKLTTSTWVDTTRMQATFPDEDFEDFAAGLARHADYYREL